MQLVWGPLVSLQVNLEKGVSWESKSEAPSSSVMESTECSLFWTEHHAFLLVCSVVYDTELNLVTQKLQWIFCAFISAYGNRLMIKSELKALSAVCFH